MKVSKPNELKYLSIKITNIIVAKLSSLMCLPIPKIDEAS